MGEFLGAQRGAEKAGVQPAPSVPARVPRSPWGTALQPRARTCPGARVCKQTALLISLAGARARAGWKRALGGPAGEEPHWTAPLTGCPGRAGAGFSPSRWTQE